MMLIVTVLSKTQPISVRAFGPFENFSQALEFIEDNGLREFETTTITEVFPDVLDTQKEWLI